MRVVGLHKHYGRRFTSCAASILEVRRGEVVGSHRSELVRQELAAALPQPAGRRPRRATSSSTASISPGPASTRRPVRRNIGMVFARFNLFPHMTALGNVAEGPRTVLRMSGSGGRRARPRSPPQGRTFRERECAAGAAVGGAAATCRDRSRVGDAARDHAFRRGHVGPRPGTRRRRARGHAPGWRKRA